MCVCAARWVWICTKPTTNTVTPYIILLTYPHAFFFIRLRFYYNSNCWTSFALNGNTFLSFSLFCYHSFFAVAFFRLFYTSVLCVFFFASQWKVLFDWIVKDLLKFENTANNEIKKDRKMHKAICVCVSNLSIFPHTFRWFFMVLNIPSIYLFIYCILTYKTQDRIYIRNELDEESEMWKKKNLKMMIKSDMSKLLFCLWLHLCLYIHRFLDFSAVQFFFEVHFLCFSVEL